MTNYTDMTIDHLRMLVYSAVGYEVREAAEDRARDALAELVRRAEEAATLRTERDRLARILAVERGDESQAPEGWEWNQHAGHWYRRDCQEVIFRTFTRGWWHRAGHAANSTHAPTALEAMEAADKARGVRHD